MEPHPGQTVSPRRARLRADAQEDAILTAGGRPLRRMETSIPGLFAAGDIRAQPVRQITNAVADGTVAAVMVQKFLEEQ